MQSEGEKTKKINILFWVPAPLGIAPGQRFRFEQYLDVLKEKGIRYSVSSFYSLKGWKLVFKKGKMIRKLLLVMLGFCKRFAGVFRALRHTHIFIYRELTPLGPPVFEWFITKIGRKKIIYDFDDAIWLPVVSDQNRVVKRFRNFGKVKLICKWSYAVSVGNHYLGDFAKKYNDHVVIIPTVVNTDLFHNTLQEHSTLNPVVGWTGTFSNLKYLHIVLPVLQRLQQRFEFTFIVIADRDPELPLKYYKFIPWQRDTETRDLLRMHIGLMPLFDDPFSKGKCGFKAIQYMALGIPAVVSPVGVNMVIVNDGVNGFVCDTEEEWEKRLTELLTNPALRKRMGEEARKKIVKEYSIQSNQADFIRLFQ